MKKTILSMISSLLIGVLLLPGKSAFALDRVNVTLPSKSFQFIILPLAKERGYMKEEGIDLNIVVMASTAGLQRVADVSSRHNQLALVSAPGAEYFRELVVLSNCLRTTTLIIAVFTDM